jgi:hypothetical protein
MFLTDRGLDVVVLCVLVLHGVDGPHLLAVNVVERGSQLSPVSSSAAAQVQFKDAQRICYLSGRHLLREAELSRLVSRWTLVGGGDEKCLLARAGQTSTLLLLLLLLVLLLLVLLLLLLRLLLLRLLLPIR